MPECRIERQSEHEADCEFARSDFQSGYGECCELAALDRDTVLKELQEEAEK